MSKFLSFFKNQDVFGEPVTVNYNGESTYKTWIGALGSLSIKIFIAIFAATQVIDLFNYKDPQITQVSIVYLSIYLSIQSNLMYLFDT